MFDVVIIGAGAAGLAAARAISGAGRTVALIEARPRIGGRVFTHHIAGLPLPIELGAEFIHGEGASTFEIVDAAALRAAELPDNHWWSRDGRWQLVEDFWGQIDRVRAKIGRIDRDLSFAEFLRKRRDVPPRLRELARSFVEGYHASHAERISAKVLRAADGEQQQDVPAGNRQFRLAGGQDALIEWLRAGLDPSRVDVRTGTVAKHVQWSAGSVIVETNRERFRARALVITIPIGVWKAPRDQEGAIAFDPPLREKDRAIEKIEPGHVVKIAFQFRERFWDEPDFVRERTSSKQWKRGVPLNFVHTSDRFMPTWWTAAPLRSPVLTGWAGGHAADALLAEGHDTMIDRALDAMSAALAVPRRRLDALLAGTYTHDWQGDPFARCAYSYAAVGGANAASELAKPLRRTIFFAGEATSSDETGTVAGAVDSGQQVAKEVLRGMG